MLSRLTCVIPFMLSDIANFFENTLDGIVDSILYGIRYVVGLIAYGISAAVLKLVYLFYNFFRVFAGLTKVSYDGESKYLINVFFDNAAVNRVYWYMAVIGFALLFVFALIAVIRKLFDPFEKQKASYGQILMGCGKSILIILLMTAIMNVALSATNLLMQRVNYMFNRATATTPVGKRTFTGEEIAKMNQIMEVIGNYAINPSYNSRYNINSCFNRIREPLLELQNAGIFEYQYGEDCWQGVLKKIAKSTTLKKDLMMDVYHEPVNRAMLFAMDTIRNNANFRPVQSVTSSGLGATEEVPIDTIIFLSGTAGAAKNDFYNQTISINDALRGPYYSGKRSIYNLGCVDEDFEVAVGAGGIDYIIIIAIGLLVIWQLITCVLTCAVRIFNMLLLYVIAPPMAATIPLDDGQRFKSWVDAMVVQCLNVFGTVIIMRLAMLYIPIIMSDRLVLFDNAFMNLIGKAILIYAGFVAAGRGADLFSGVLLGNGGAASAHAGNMQAQGLVAASALGGLAEDLTGITKAKDKLQKSYKSMVSQGGLIGTGINSLRKSPQQQKGAAGGAAGGAKAGQNAAKVGAGNTLAGGNGDATGTVGEDADMDASGIDNGPDDIAPSRNTGAVAGANVAAGTVSSAGNEAGDTGRKIPPKRPAGTGSTAVAGTVSGGSSTGGSGGGSAISSGGGGSDDLQSIKQSLMDMQLQQQKQRAESEQASNNEDYEEFDEVATTGLGSALGIHNTLSSDTQKAKRKSRPKAPEYQSHTEQDKYNKMRREYEEQQLQQLQQSLNNNTSGSDDDR